MTARRFVLAPIAIALALIATPSAQSDPYLDVIRNLRHPKPETRLDALAQLNRAAYVDAAEAVAALVTDPDDRVQAAAIDAELSFFLIDRVSGGKSRAQNAFNAGPLLRGSAPAPALLVDRLTAAMRDDNARIAFDAVHALGFLAERPLRPTQIAALVGELDHYDPIMRAATARVLARLHASEAVDKLVQGTVDSNAVVQRFAVDALGWLGEPRAIPQLRQLAGQPKQPLRAGAYLALARLGSAEETMQFRQLAADRDPSLRRAGIEGIGRVGDRESIEIVRRAMTGDRSPEVRLAAAFALHKLGEVQSHVIASRLGVRAEAIQAQEYLFELGREATPGVAATLEVTIAPAHRAALVQTIGYLGDGPDVAFVEPALKDPDPRVARAATHAVTRLRWR